MFNVICKDRPRIIVSFNEKIHNDTNVYNKRSLTEMQQCFRDSVEKRLHEINSCEGHEGGNPPTTIAGLLQYINVKGIPDSCTQLDVRRQDAYKFALLM